MTLDAVLLGALGHVNLVREGEHIPCCIRPEIHHPAELLADDVPLRPKGQRIRPGGAHKPPAGEDAPVQQEAQHHAPGVPCLAHGTAFALRGGPHHQAAEMGTGVVGADLDGGAPPPGFH